MTIAGMCRTGLLALLLLLLIPSVYGKETAQTPVLPDAVDTANVVVNGRALFRVMGIFAFPADKRARQIEERIENLAKDSAFDPATISIEAKDDRHVLMAGNNTLMIIITQDAIGEGIDRNLLAEVYLEKIQQVIVDYREERQPEVIIRNLLYATIATVIMGLLIFGVIVSFRKTCAFLDRRFKRRVEKLEAKSLRLVQAEQVWKMVLGALNVIKALLILMLIYIYLNSVMGLFPWTRYIAQTLIHYTIDPLLTMGKAIVDYLPKLFFLIMLILVVRYLLKLNHMFFSAIAYRRIKFQNFDPEWSWPTHRIVRLLMIIFALVVAYPYIPGSDSAAFKGLSLLAGVLLSLSSSSLLSNILAGYTMIYRRAFKVGDRIKIGDTVGDVMEMRLMVTHLRSLKNENIVLPNSQILNSEVTNYSTMAAQEGLILHTTVGIGYEVPWRQVEAMLLMAAEKTPELRTDKPPFVLQKSLGDFAVNYELNVYCKDASQMTALYHELHRNIQDVFNEYDVQIMTPAYESDTAEPKTVPKAKWYAEPAQAPTDTSGASS